MAKRPRILKASINARAARGNGVVTDVSNQVPRVSQSSTPVSMPGPSANEGQGAGWFGPLNPMNPSAPPQVAGRAFDYASGYNLNIQPKAYDLIGFPTLRALADSYDLLRIILETRKDQIEHLRWQIVPVDEASQLDGDLKTRAKKIKDFFRRPDKDHFWGQWIRSILEDLLVLDAPAIYVRKTLGGSLYALEQIDGATVTRKIDDYGRTPETGTAYQQVLKGLPAVDYTKEELMYRPRNTRVHKVYGFSPVEQIIMTVNIALRRQVFQLNYFTEGNIPEALIGVPETWTPDQIRVFQDWFDNMLAGNLAERRRARFVPNAVGKTYIPTKETELFGAAEEWFARVVCFAFSIPPSAFIKMRAAAGENQEDTAKEEGLGPLKNWIKDLMDTIIIDLFGEDDLQFSWMEADELDPVKKQAIIVGYTKTGQLTINEGRRKMGELPFKGDQYDKPMVMTAMGYTPITGEATQPTMTGNDTRPPDAKGQQAKPTDQPPSQVSGEKPAPKEVATTKTPDFFQRVRKVTFTPIQPNRPIVNKHITSTTALVHKHLTRWGNSLADDIEELLIRSDVRKADDDPELDVDKLLKHLDWSMATAFEHAMQDELYAVASDSGQLAAVQLKAYVDPEVMFNKVNDRAVAWADKRAAELVSLDGDRNLVEGTRNILRNVITQGLQENLGAKEIANSIRDSVAFSEERASTIANYEIASANSQGSLEGYREARDNGVKLKKSWSVDEDPCPECQGNADDGAIDLDDTFSSGDDAPAAHPWCMCALVPEVED